MEYYEAKFLCQNLLERETRNLELKTKTYTFGKLSYYNENYFKEALSKNVKIVMDREEKSIPKKISRILNTFQMFIFPFYAGGAYHKQENSLIVFIDDVGIPILKNEPVSLLKRVYHELYHAFYNKNKKEGFPLDDFHSFACNLEYFMMSCHTETFMRYLYSHNSFLFEILADKYAVERTQEYITQNPNAYNYNLRKLARMRKKSDNQYNNYDLSKLLDTIIRDYPEASKIEGFDNHLFEIFLNEDGTFKDITESLTDERLATIDKRILFSFFNTKSFLQEKQNSILGSTFSSQFVSVEEENFKKR